MSDHISGPRALADPIADITDLYAFPSPSQPQTLVLVMNTLPFAQPSDLFSDGLIYRFRIRPLSPTAPDGYRAPFDTSGRRTRHRLRLLRSDGRARMRVPGAGGHLHHECGRVGHLPGRRPGRRFGARDPRLRGRALGPVHHGRPRGVEDDRDPEAGVHRPERDLSRRQERAEPRGRDRYRLPSGDAALVGVVAETLTRGRLNVRIERVGRPEVKNMMLAPKQFDTVNRDLEIRDLYNMEDAFHLGDSYLGAYRARLNANLAFWDGLDGKTDWPLDENGNHPLTELVLADFLVVDVTKPYAEHGSYLEIELAARRGEPHRTCGGRALNDDVIDTLFTQLINAGNGPVIRDGVDHSSRPAGRAFPYLSAPNPDPPKLPAHH